MSQQVDLSGLGFPGDLFYMPCCGFGAFKCLGQLLHPTCRESVQGNAAITDSPGHKIFVFKEKPEDVPVQYFSCFLGVLGQIYLCLDRLIPFINAIISLSKAHQ